MGIPPPWRARSLNHHHQLVALASSKSQLSLESYGLVLKREEWWDTREAGKRSEERGVEPPIPAPLSEGGRWWWGGEKE